MRQQRRRRCKLYERSVLPLTEGLFVLCSACNPLICFRLTTLNKQSDSRSTSGLGSWSRRTIRVDDLRIPWMNCLHFQELCYTSGMQCRAAILLAYGRSNCCMSYLGWRQKLRADPKCGALPRGPMCALIEPLLFKQTSVDGLNQP